MTTQSISTEDAMVGKTIESVCYGNAGWHEAMILTFTDGTKATIIGGGYEGYGDYIKLIDPEDIPDSL